jgi:perosamine synthetase
MAIPVFRPSVKRKDMDAVLTCLVSDQLGPGTYSEDLVHALLERCDADAGVALRESLRGIEIALRTLELGDRPRIAISALSSRVYAFVIEKLGMEAVIVDVQADLPVIDLESLETIHGHTPVDALILEHHLGYSPEIERVTQLGIPVVQDISRILYHSPRPEYIGDLLILSLEPEHIITTGGGVFLAASRKKWSKKLNSAVDAYPGDIYLPDMNAAMGVIQVKELKSFLEHRQELSGVLQRSIMESRHKMISLEEQLVPSCLPVLLAGSLQDAQHYGVKKQVEILPAFDGSYIQERMHHFEADQDAGAAPAEQYPNAARFALRTALLPLYPSIGRKELELLQKVIKTLP